MSIADAQKLDYLWKKVGYGVTKTDINSIKNATNESISSPLLLRGDRLWTESDKIPAVMPSDDTDYVKIYNDNKSNTVLCVSDLTASENRTWKTNLTDWIPPELGSTYQVKVYLSTSTSSPQTNGTQVFSAGSGNFDQWFFDYQSGVLHFIGNTLPQGISGKNVYISGARYVGLFGVASAAIQNQIDTTNLELSSLVDDLNNLTTNVQNIQNSIQNFKYIEHTQTEIEGLLENGQVGIIYDNDQGKFKASNISSGGGVPFLGMTMTDGTEDPIGLLTTFDGQELISGILRFTTTDGSRDDIDLIVNGSGQ